MTEFKCEKFSSKSFFELSYQYLTVVNLLYYFQILLKFIKLLCWPDLLTLFLLALYLHR